MGYGDAKVEQPGDRQAAEGQQKSSDEWQERDEGRSWKCQQPCMLTIIPAAHTPPLRLSARLGEKMNQVAKSRDIKYIVGMGVFACWRGESHHSTQECAGRMPTPQRARRPRYGRQS